MSRISSSGEDLIRSPFHQMDGDAGLSVDQGDVVSDDVVQVTSDADTFGRHTLLRFLLTGALRVFSPLLHGRHIGAA
ncbi:hypothetical protein ACFV29_31275 [Streptomyces sp. NPDC059690]|uniref:hypothetical protein n=1 Tax=Streptomyces sp. NPDC059690 TaxID=3346907 RepID=UPI0036BF817C